MNYFELFQLPVAFTLDNEQLDQQLRLLQSQYHPDVQVDSYSVQDVKQKNEQISAVINTAYQTLKSPDSRASHLLELVGKAGKLSQSITDLDFLDKAMDFRIELDEADRVGLDELKPKLQTWIDEISTAFNQAYQGQNWYQAIDFAQKLKFLVKIDKDLAKKVDELSSSQNDDDLYV